MTEDLSPQEKEDMWRIWATKAQQGDKNAYNLLLKDILPYIRNIILPGCANPDWADDITQEVIISVHKSLKTYKSDYSFKSWLYSIIQFRKIDFLRAHYRLKDKKQILFDTQKENVTFSALSGELKDIEGALDNLSDKQRKVFKLVKIEGYSAKEVAEEMKMSVSAVKVSVHRSTAKLKEVLGEH
jgi:RNA polymerase sigma-70 factor (ECF subfamily)